MAPRAISVRFKAIWKMARKPGCLKPAWPTWSAFARAYNERARPHVYILDLIVRTDTSNIFVY